MYNRYIPQPDGSHRRRQMEEPRKPVPQPQKPKRQEPPPCPQPIPEPPKIPQKDPPHVTASHNGKGLGSFFRQLLPKELDTGDLLILLLLLLMAGDCEDDRSNALLTMALYFLM